MVRISSQETRRLFGPMNRPSFETNVRHRAFLRKSIEAHPAEHIAEVFHGDPTKLRMAMGLASTFGRFGRIKTNFIHNGHLVSYETDPLDLEAQEALHTYCNAYDAYYMARGNGYAIRNPAAQGAMQAAEQGWHNWIVTYRAARGMPGRSGWDLEPLPGLQRVHVAPAPAPAPTPPTHPRAAPTIAVASTPRVERRPAAFPTLPTPPPSSPGPVLIDLSHIDDEPRRQPSQKRRFLGEIDISDEEEAAVVRPRKKARFLGYIDLTN